MTGPHLARRFTIEGRVQGVGFRWWVRDTANIMGIGGWAMNRRDGAVEVEAVGTRQQLDAFEARLHEGPTHSHVTGVFSSTAVPAVPAGSFEIRFER